MSQDHLRARPRPHRAAGTSGFQYKASGLETGALSAHAFIDGVRNVVVFANIGHSVFSGDGGHFYAGGGFKVVIGR